MNCWEFKKCGREAGGAKSKELGICPSYPNHGKRCAIITGTLCHDKKHDKFAAKVSDCMRCDFYNSKHYERQLKL